MGGVNLFGQMVKFIKDNSKMILDMVKELISIRVERWENLCGFKAKSIIDFIQNSNKHIVADYRQRDNLIMIIYLDDTKFIHNK